MAFSKPLLVLPFLLVILVVVDAQVTPDDPSVMESSNTRSLLDAPKIDCPSKCLERCGRNWKNKMCNKMCNACCGKCNCVPPGTGQETRRLCPCYDTMTNPKTGKLKCP